MSQQINLFNPVFLTQKKYFSVLAMLQALGLIALGAGLFYGYALYQVGLLARQSADTAQRYVAEQAKFANFSTDFSPQKSSQLLSAELNRLEAEAAAQKEILDALKTGAVGNTEGYSEYLRAFARQSVGGLWLTGFELEGDAGGRMSLSGGALDPLLVPKYIQRLGKEKVMQGKTFAYLQMQQPKEAAGAPSRAYLEFTMQSSESHGEVK